MSFKKLFIKSEEDTPVIKIKKEANFTPGQGMTSEQYDRRVSEQNPYPAFGLGGVGTMFKPNSDVINTSENSSELITIEEIYKTSTSIENLDNSIYKIREFAESLPKELPTETKRQSVLGIFNTIKVDVNSLIDDGITRIDILLNTSDVLLKRANDIVAKNIAEIAELAAKIEALKNENTLLTKTSEDQKALISKEVQDIHVIIDFINPDNVQEVK